MATVRVIDNVIMTGSITVSDDKIKLTGLPTADSGLEEGQLWLDGTTLKVSAGS